MAKKLGTAFDVPSNVFVPDELDSRLGKLTFTDGAPSDETVEKIYDNLDFTRALDAYMNGYQLASLKAMHNGLLAHGAEDNGGVMIWSKLMDSPVHLPDCQCRHHLLHLHRQPQRGTDGRRDPAGCAGPLR